MASKQVGRPAKSVYDMTTKQYCNFLRKNRISKKWILSLLETEIYVIPAEDDTKLTLAGLVDKYGNDLKEMVGECCFEL